MARFYNLAPAQDAARHDGSLESQLVLSLREEKRCGSLLRAGAIPVYSEYFDFAGCVNITHRAPRQFSYRWSRLVNPKETTL